VTRANRQGVFLELDPDAVDRLRLIHEATGAPKWAIVNSLLERAELDERGIPTWWDARPAQQELLDFDATGGGADVRRTA
jgi:hypothetical protein